jgi:D-ribulokinase
MVPGLWLNEGGQSAAGAAIEHLLQMHPHSAQVTHAARQKQQTLADWLAAEVESRGGADMIPELVGELHVVPEFLGNRAPFADPDARALIAGLDMRADLESLLALYLAGLCGLGYGARQIVRAQQEKGIAVDTIVVSGGAAKSRLVRQVLADTTGLTVAASASPEAVLLGSAMLGSVASGVHASLGEAMQAMSVLGEIHQPQATLEDWTDRRFGAFEALQKVGRAIRGAS